MPVHCFDCEVEVPEAQTLCDSCAAHREDGHVPVPLSWCHGAGPDGQQRERLEQEPRTLKPEELVPWT